MMVQRLKAACAAALLGGGLLASGVAVAADEPATWLPENFTASVTVTSDYAFRGISQTLNDPAGQFNGEWTPGGGPIYIGAFVSYINFRDFATGNKTAAVEVDALAGVRGEYNILKWDVGAVFYVYPGQNHNNLGLATNFNYAEGAVKTSWDVMKLFSIVANVNASPNYQGDSGTGLYAEAGIDATLPFDINVSGRFGRQWIEQNAVFGVPDYNTWSISFSREFFGRVILGAGYFDTSISRANCFGGQTFCEARGIGYATFKF